MNRKPLTPEQKEMARLRSSAYYYKNHTRIRRECKSKRKVDGECVRAAQREYVNSRYANDVEFRMARCLRARLRKAVKLVTTESPALGKTRAMLGCTLLELKAHLESKFQAGMTWGNHGEWHIDHIKPLTKFNLKEKNERLRANHYTNLQPLWARDNIQKFNHWNPDSPANL